MKGKYILVPGDKRILKRSWSGPDPIGLLMYTVLKAACFSPVSSSCDHSYYKISDMIDNEFVP